MRLGILAILFSLSAMASAFAQEAPKLRLCTGGDGGVYFFAGNLVKKNATTAMVDVLSTSGSMDNLDKIMSGTCDAAFVQTDALKVYSSRNARIIPAIEVATGLYDEYVHLICGRDTNISSISDLNASTNVAVGDDGSGNSVTWQSFVLADKKKYGNVPLDNRSGLRALNAVQNGQASCMLYVGGVGSQLLKGDAANLSDRVVIVPVKDSALESQKDSRNRPLYKPFELPSTTYGAMMPSGFFGTKSAATVSVEAVMVVSTEWINKNSRAYDGLLRAVNSSLPEIRKKATPQ